VDIGFLLCRIPDIGREFARLDTPAIFEGNEDAKQPFVTVCQVMRGGLNGVSLVLNRLGHGLHASFSATEAWVAGPPIHHRQCRHSGPSHAQGHPIPIPGSDACIRMDQPAGSISLVRRPLEVSSCDGFLSGSIVFIEFGMGGGQCCSGLASVNGA
jgi:hypothetical protein